MIEGATCVHQCSVCRVEEIHEHWFEVQVNEITSKYFQCIFSTESLYWRKASLEILLVCPVMNEYGVNVTYKINDESS